MDLPKFNETFIPILEVLSDEKIIRHRELWPVFVTFLKNWNLASILKSVEALAAPDFVVRQRKHKEYNICQRYHVSMGLSLQCSGG